MAKGKGYIVYREVQDLGPNGSYCAYVRVDKPRHGEKFFHGSFLPRTDCDGNRVYDYVGKDGKPSFEVFNDDDLVEEF